MKKGLASRANHPENFSSNQLTRSFQDVVFANYALGKARRDYEDSSGVTGRTVKDLIDFAFDCRSPANNTSDAIAVGAACVGAGLALLGIIVAILSVWGYLNIRSSAKKASQATAKAEVLRLLDEKSEMGAKLREEIYRRIAAEADMLYDDLALSGAFTRTGAETSERIAENYPKEGK
jgi:hypothetical protein